MSNRPAGVTRIVWLLTIGSIINLALGFYGFFGDLVFGLPRYYNFVRTRTSGFFPDWIGQEILLEMSIAVLLIGVAFFSLYAAYRLYSAKSWSHSLALVLTTTTVLIYLADVLFFDLIAASDAEFFELRQLVGSYFIPFTVSVVCAGIAWFYLYAGARKEPPTGLWYVVPFFYGVIGGLVAFDEVKDDDPNRAIKLLRFGMIWSLIPAFIWIALFLRQAGWLSGRALFLNFPWSFVAILVPMLPLILLEITGCVMWFRGRALQN